MKKQDLKSGMLVELGYKNKDIEVGLIVGNTITYPHSDWDSLDGIDNDLCDKFNGLDGAIFRVSNIKTGSNLMIGEWTLENIENDLIWQRPEPKEMIEIDGVEYEKEWLKDCINSVTLDILKEEPEPLKKEYMIEYDNKEDHLYSIINADSIETRLYYDSEIDESFLSHGRYRKTKENADYSLQRNKRANRLEALVEDLQGELGVGDCYLQYHKELGTWGYANCIREIDDIERLNQNYMKYETAIKICQMLNNEEYSLDGEG